MAIQPVSKPPWDMSGIGQIPKVLLQFGALALVAYMIYIGAQVLTDDTLSAIAENGARQVEVLEEIKEAIEALKE